MGGVAIGQRFVRAFSFVLSASLLGSMQRRRSILLAAKVTVQESQSDIKVSSVMEMSAKSRALACEVNARVQTKKPPHPGWETTVFAI